MKTKKHTKLYEWQKRCNDGSGSCAKCGSREKLTVDHIVPISILSQFILDRYLILYNMEENFEILCTYCNGMKGSRIDPRNEKVYLILERVIAEAKREHLTV